MRLVQESYVFQLALINVDKLVRPVIRVGR